MGNSESNPMPDLTDRDIRRFWRNVDKTPGKGPWGDCWEWKLSRNEAGYGKMMIVGPSNTRPYLASRVAYKINAGKDPAPLFVLHNCDNPACVRPEHLYKGTRKENARDMMARNRQGGQLVAENVRGEKKNRAKLTEDQVRDIRTAYSTKEMNQYQLAVKYGVTKPAIGYIVRRKNWAHVK